MGNVAKLNEKREAMSSLVSEMLDMPQMECEVQHTFTPGLYIRQITMPVGVVIGKIHATEHANIITKGRCTVVTTEGHEEHQAGDVFVSRAGVQKAVIIHEECTWITTHVTDSTDLEEIEKQVISKSYDQLENDSLLLEAEGLLE